MLLIGLDVGTQSTKALLYDDEKQQTLAVTSVNYTLLATDIPGRAEQDPETWLNACIEAIQQLLKDRNDKHSIKGIGVSGQQHGMVTLDKDGNIVRPAKLWCDVESSAEADALTQKYGHIIVPSLTLPKILWLKKNEPDNYAKTRTILLPHDYINYRLTGRLCMESGDASGTGAFDILRRAFDEDAMHYVDDALHEMFPPLMKPDEAIGTLTETAAQCLGLSSEIKVSPGSGDNMMSALGAGAVTDGVVVLSLGTSGTLFCCSSKPMFDLSGIVCPFCDATGRWLPLVCTMSCTGVLKEVKDCFNLSHEELTHLAEQEPVGCNGVNFLPYFTGERTPNWPNASGAVIGLSPGTLKPGILYRAALEGATFTLLNGMERMKQMGVSPKELRVVGGGSQNRLWRRIIADAFQLPLRFPLQSESAALGAALQAGAICREQRVAAYVASQSIPMSQETIEPNPSMKEKYESAYRRHVNLGTRLFSTQS